MWIIHSGAGELKICIVRLSEEERVALDALVSKGVASAQKHANLLNIDADGPA
jgi:hypothetical protein